MKSIEERIEEHRRAIHITPDEAKLALTLQQSKKEFYKNAGSVTATYFEFLYQQCKYIRKLLWILQFVILAALYWLLHMGQSNELLQRSMGVLAPLFVILLVPELWKNYSCNAMEIEGVSYYSLRQIYAARILLFAAADGLLLSVFGGMAVLTTAISAKDMLLQFFLPMIVTCCICFRTLCSKHGSSEYLAILLSMVWSSLWVLIVLRDTIYNAISIPVWAVICCLAVLYLAFVVHKVIRNSENYWEVTVTWN